MRAHELRVSISHVSSPNGAQDQEGPGRLCWADGGIWNNNETGKYSALTLCVPVSHFLGAGGGTSGQITGLQMGAPSQAPALPSPVVYWQDGA